MKNTMPAVSEILYGQYIADFTDGGIILSANDGFCKITGYTQQDIENGSVCFYNFIPEEDYDIYIKKVEELQKERRGGYLEHRFKCKNGRYIHVICYADDYTAENGHFRSKITICDFTENINLREKYRLSKMELDALMDNVPGGVVLYEIKNNTIRIADANDDYYSMLGYTDKKLHPGVVGHLLKKGEMSNFLKTLSRCIENRSDFSYEFKLTKYDGKPAWMCLKGKYFDTSENGSHFIYAILLDVSNAKKAEREILNQTERFKIIAENTEEVYFEYNVTEDTMFLANCINRYGEEDNIIKNFWNELKCKPFVHPDDFKSYLNSWIEICSVPQRGSIEFRTMAYDDDYTWYKLPYVSVANEQGEVTNVYGRLFSIEHVKNLKMTIDSERAEIERLTTTDAVTGLLNRKAFKERVSSYLASGFDSSGCYGIVYSDINDFSYVNDNFGSDAGNQMLYDFAEIIRSTETNIYGCRIYSDYYVGLYKAPSRDALIESIKLRNARFTEFHKHKYPASDIHISSGLYFIDSDDVDVTIAMDNANLARRSVKGIKDIPCGIYTERMRRQRSYEQAIAIELLPAIKNGNIELFLQPKFSLDTREIIGAEALSRWRNSDGSYKLPYEFISILENVGYIVELDFFIYEQVLKTLLKWKNKGMRMLPISINFSRQHNNYSSFVGKITEMADQYGIDRNLLEIEITESSFTKDINVMFTNMKKLRENGFKIDIDDFGMGYSSLSVLLDAPVDIVKLDKVFIDNIVASTQAREYVNQICSLINSTNKEIIFEGVETERQAEILCRCGHRMAQGWLFDKALSVKDFENKYMKVQVTNK